MNVKYLMSKNPIRVCPYSQCTKLQNWLLIHSKMTLHRILSVNNLEMYPLWIYKSPHSRYRYLLSLYCKLTRVERKEERNIPFSFNLIPWFILPFPGCVACHNVCPATRLYCESYQALGNLFIFTFHSSEEKLHFP